MRLSLGRAWRTLPGAMSWIQLVAPQEASPKLRSLYERACDPVSGQLDEILQVHSLHPAGLEAHLALYGAVMHGTRGVPKLERELLALIVSLANQCHY